MPHELTAIVSGPANTGKGVIGLIIEKALHDNGIIAKYLNNDGQSEESLKEAYERRDEILKQVDPRITIIENHVGKSFKIPSQSMSDMKIEEIEKALADEIVLGSGDQLKRMVEIQRLLGQFRDSLLRAAGVTIKEG